MLISAFAFDGTPEKAVKKAFSEGDICVSPAILTEYRNVPIELEGKGKLTHDKDLLEMDEPGLDFKILTPKEFVEEVIGNSK